MTNNHLDKGLSARGLSFEESRLCLNWGLLGAHWGSEERGGGYLRRFGAHTRARFLACMLVLLLKDAMWARCRIRYSKVL